VKCRLGLFVGLVALALPFASHAYDVRYEARILPDRGTAQVSIQISQNAGVVRSLAFAADEERLFDTRADGELEREEEEGGSPRWRWHVPRAGGTLRYSVQIDHLRDGAEYDARCAQRWMVARGEDLFPPMSTRFLAGSEKEADARLRFVLPPRWTIAHPFEETDGRIVIEQPHRSFDQPKGWILAGSLDRRSQTIEESRVSLVAPTGHDARLDDLQAFLRFTLPVLREAIGTLPPRLLIALAGDPMWRGGLSAPGSVYLHADRPLIEADASSPLLHELMHTATRARSEPGEDWIVEGLAEYYSREILRRSGAVSEETHASTLRNLRGRGARVRRLEGEAAGAETALAVTFFHDLDERIREATEGERSLDDVVATMVDDVATLDRSDLLVRIEATTGYDATKLLRDRIPPQAEGGRQ